jgi:hypothetical protein
VLTLELRLWKRRVSPKQGRISTDYTMLHPTREDPSFESAQHVLRYYGNANRQISLRRSRKKSSEEQKRKSRVIYQQTEHDE